MNVSSVAQDRIGAGPRVVHVGELDVVRDTGSGMAVAALIEGQTKLGISVALVTSSQLDRAKRAEFSDAGVTVVSHSAVGLGAFRGFREVATAIRRLNPSIVHFHSGFVPLHPLVAPLVRRPFVVTPHGAYARQVLERSRAKKFVYFALLEKRYLLGAGAIIALTLDEAQGLGAMFGLKSNVYVVPNALPNRKIRDADQIIALRAQRRTEGLVQRGVFLGRLDVQHKGLDLLANVAREVNARGVPMHVSCFGPDLGTRSGDLSQLVRASGSSLSFKEPIYGDAKRTAMVEADFYVQLSRWEAFGMAVIEALAAGVPAVISESMSIAADLRAADVAEVVPRDQTVIVDRLVRLLGSPRDRLVHLSDRGRTFVRENLSSRSVAERTMAAYDAAMLAYAAREGSQ